MSDLKILIDTGIQFNASQVKSEIDKIQGQYKINFGFNDVSSQLQDLMSKIQNVTQNNNNINLGVSTNGLENVTAKVSEIKNSANEVIQRTREVSDGFGNITKTVETLNQKTGEWSTKTEQVVNNQKAVTDSMKLQEEEYSKLSRLQAEQLSLESQLKEAKRVKNKELQKELENTLAINQGRQKAISDTLVKNNAVNYEQEAQLLTEKNNLIKQITKSENEAKQARIDASRMSADKNASAYYNDLIKKSLEYKASVLQTGESLASLDKFLSAFKGQMFSKNGGLPAQFKSLDYSKQTQLLKIYNDGLKEKQKLENSKKSANEKLELQYYTQLNKLLVEEYQLKTKIAQAKQDRYLKSDIESEQKVITLKEQEYRKQLQINNEKRKQTQSYIDNNGLTNLKYACELEEQRKKLASDLLIVRNQVNSTIQIENAKSVASLEMFKRNMETQMTSTQSRFNYVSGATEKLNEYRNILKGVISENGRWYATQDKYGNSIQKTVITAKELRQRFREVKSEIVSNISFTDRLRRGISTMMTYFLGGNIIYKIVAQIKEAFSYVNEMNKALTNVMIITGKSKEEVSGLAKEYIDLGKELGTTSNLVAETAEVFYRQGKSIEDTKKLIKSTTMMSQLSGIGGEEASQYMTSILNGFNLDVEETEDVVSKLVSVDNSAATSVAGLSSAMQHCSNSSRLVGVDIDRLIGYLGTMQEATQQSGDTLGNMWKTVTARYSNVKLGKVDDDGLGINDTEKALARVGISIRDSKYEFRDFQDVLDEVGKHWKEYDDVTKSSIATTLGGTRQREYLITLFENYDRALELSNISTKSAGLAQKRYNVYLESTEAKMNKLKTTALEFYTTVINSDFVNFVLDLTTGILNLVNSLGGLVPILITIGGFKFASAIPSIVKAINGSALVINLKALLLPLGQCITQGKSLTVTLGLMGVAFKSAAVKSIASASAMTIFTTALKGVAIAVGIGIAVWQHYKRKQEEARQSALEGINELNEQRKGIEEYATKYKELQTALVEAKGNEEATYNIKVQMYELQKQLNEEYGTAKTKIDFMTDAYRDQVQIIRDLNKEKAQEWLNKKRGAIDTAEKTMTKVKTYSLGTYSAYDTDEITKAKLEDLIKKYNIEEKFSDTNGIKRRLYIDADVETANKVINEFMADLDKNTKNFTDEEKEAFDNIYKKSSKSLNATTKDIENDGKIWKEALMNSMTLDDTLANKYNELTDLVNEYNDAVVKGDVETIAKTKENIEAIQSEIQNDDKFTKYISLFNDLINAMEKFNSIKLQNPNFNNIQNNTDRNSLESMKASLERQILIETDTTKLQEAKDLLAEVKTQLESLGDETKVNVEISDIEKLNNVLTSISSDTEVSQSIKDDVKTIQDAIANGTKVSIKDINALKSAIPQLKDKFPELSKAIQNSLGDLLDFSQALESIQNKVDSFSTNYDKLNTAIEETKAGKVLDGDDIVELTRLYPELSSAVKEVNGVYTIELDALVKAKENYIQTTKDQISIETKTTQAALQQSQERIKQYAKEKGITDNITFKDNGEILMSEALSKAKGYDGEFQKMLKDYAEQNKQYQQALNEYNNIDVVTQNASEENESQNNYPEYVEKGLDDIIEIEQDKLDDLEKNKDNLQKALEFAELTGDKEGAEKLKKQIESQYDEIGTQLDSSKKVLIEKRNEIFKSLNNEGYFTDLQADTISNVDVEKTIRALEEKKAAFELQDNDEAASKVQYEIDKVQEATDSLIGINEKLDDNFSQSLENKIAKIQNYIDSLNKIIEEAEEHVNDTENEVEIDVTTVGVEDNNYLSVTIENEKKLIDAKVELQELYKQQYEAIAKKLGNADNDACKEKKQKWQETEKEIYDIRKEYAQKKIEYANYQYDSLDKYQDKVIEMLQDEDDKRKDILEKQKDAINEDADARKEALEDRSKELDLIKEEYDNQNKINELRKKIADNLSDINALYYDDSADAIQSKIEIANDLQKNQQDLADELLAQSIDDAKDSIDRAIEAIEEETQARIDGIDAQIQVIDDKTEHDYEDQANRMIESDAEGTYQKLLEWNRTEGDRIDATINTLWANAQPVLEQLNVGENTMLEVMNNLKDAVFRLTWDENSLDMKGFNGETYDGGVNQAEVLMGGKEEDKSAILTQIGNAISTFITPITDLFKQSMEKIDKTPKEVNVSPVFTVNANGGIDNPTYNKMKSYVDNVTLNVIPKLIEKSLESSLQVNTSNTVGRTR